MTEYKMTLSTIEPNNYVGLIKLRQGDVASQSIQATITANGQLFKFDNLSVFFNAVLPNGNVIRDKVTEVDYVNSKLNYIVADSFLQEVAQVTAWFSFENGEKIIDSTKNFQYSVIPGWKECIPQGNYIYELSEIQREIEEIIGNKDFTTLLSELDFLKTNIAYLDNNIKTLDNNIKTIEQKLEWKASTKWIESKFNAISSNAPKSVLSSLEEIQNTYPNGANGIVIASNTGKWYYYDEGGHSWKEGGIYQSRGLNVDEVKAYNIDFVESIEQLLTDKIEGSIYLWGNTHMGTFNGDDWLRFMPVSIKKGHKYYLSNIRGIFSYAISSDGVRLVKKFSETDVLVTTEYTPPEDCTLYVSSRKLDATARVFNASIEDLGKANIDFSNLPDGYISIKIPKLSLDIKPEELSFINDIKQLVDERTFKIGEYWTGSGDNTSQADTFGIYPKIYLQAGKTYGLKNVRGYFTHYLDISGNKLKTFATTDATTDVLVSQNFTPEENGYILITRRVSDEPSKVIKGGLSKASLLNNLDYGTSTLESTVNFVSNDVDFVQETKQMLTDRITGSFWIDDRGYINRDFSETWSRYSPVNLIKDKTYFIVGVRGFLTYVTPVDDSHIIKKLSDIDNVVTTEYTPTEDLILYVTTRNSDPKPKVFNASVAELSADNVDMNNLPDDYNSLKIPKLSVDVKATDINFLTEIKQILDENTFVSGNYYTGNGQDKMYAEDCGVYPPITLTKGVKYGLKDVRGVFTYFLSFDNLKLKQFSTKDELISEDYTPPENGYLLITRRLIEPQSKVIQGGLSKASSLKNLDYGTSALESTVNFVSNDNNNTRFGLKIDGIDSTQKTIVDSLAYMSPVDTWQQTKGFIDSVDVYVKDAGTYNFAIGNIDQNQLIVSPRTFTKELSSGYNSLSLRDENISIFSGEQLFFESKDNTLYAPKGEQNLIQDAQHTTSNDGYSGKIMYRTNNAIPFTYVVTKESVDEKVDDLIRTTEKLDPIVSELEIFKRTPMVTSQNGTKFRLLVDNNGNLSTVSNIPKRVVVFGNSISSHGWLQGIGMAASSKDKDYFTLVKNYISSKNPSAVVERGNGSSWESAPDTRRQTFENQMMLTLKPDTDIVILQFGDNLNTDEKRKNLETDIPNLISWIRNASPKALIYWVGVYYASQDFVDRLKRICAPLDVTFVDIYKFSKDPKYKSYVGAIIDLPDGTKYTVTDPGVASHPGDLGHKAIADEIIKNFLF